MKASRTITLLAVLASLAFAAPAAASADAPAQEEYILQLPSAGDGSESAGQQGRSAGDDGRGRSAGAADPGTLSTITADAGNGGSTILVVILAATTLAGLSVAIVKATK